MKSVVVSIMVAAGLIGGVMVFSSKSSQTTPPVNGNNVRIENGIQIVTINARGGYQPRKSVAKAGVPTIIQFKTNGTFDCSSSVRVPSVGISRILPQTGTTDIDIGTQPVGKLNGSCGMGMYNFEIEFEN